jgi:hypothetical protein
MNNTLIYIGDDLLDLDPSSVIAITIQALNVGDLKIRNVSYTNSFKLPATENNCRIFGYLNDERSLSSKAYQFNNAKIIQNGIETLRGVCVLKQFNGKEFVINIFEDLFDLFKSLEGKKIKDIDPISDTDWSQEEMDNLRNTTSNVISAIVQWGKGDAIFNYNFFLPSFFYHTIVKNILTSTGLTLSGSILTDARFTDLVVPFCGDSFYISDVTTYTIVLEYNEAVPLTPTWSARFEIVSPFTRRGLTVTGNGDTDTLTMPAPDDEVICTVYKTSNSGLAQDAGDVAFYLNGSPVDTQFFLNGDNVGIGSPKQYIFTGLTPGDEMKAIITEG